MEAEPIVKRDQIRVVIVDDHALLREGMRELLEQESDLAVVGEAASGGEAVEVVNKTNPDVVLMDVVMPGLSGVEATRRIRASNPGTAVLVLSAYDDDSYVLGLLEAGAAGYLLKSSRGHELVQAIRAVLSGDDVLHPEVTARLLARVSRSPAHALPPGNGELPTERELAVIRLAATGLSNKEIASRLAVSLPTVKAHLVNIFNKMGVRSRTEAVLLALRKGWIGMEDVTPEAAAERAPEPFPVQE